MTENLTKNDALIVFPPAYIPTELQPGVAAVVAAARSSGLRVEVIDANIGGIEFLLRGVDKERATSSFAVLRDARWYRPEAFEEFRRAKQAIEELSMVVSRVYGEHFLLRRNTVQYIPKYDAQSRKGIIMAVEAFEDNLFYPYFKENLLPKLVEKYYQEGYKAVGIGITDRKQAIPGFVIARMIRQALPEVKVIAGGNFISRGRDVLLDDDEINRRLFDYVDYLMYLEADYPFAELVTAIAQGQDHEKRRGIEKLIWREEGKIESTPLQKITNVSTIPLPEFEGLQSWTPKPAVAYNFQRGCNYGKCGFCGLMDGYDSYSMRSEKQAEKFVPRRKRIEEVLEDLKEFERRGQRYINFTDETFFAVDMERLARRIVEEKINIKWTCYARVEDKFTDPEFCEIIAQAGCEFIQFGVESASLRSLQLMAKGVDNTKVYTILQNTHKAGIMNHVFVMVGYPGETIYDALTLFPFLEQTKEYTFTVKPTWFKLARGSPDAYQSASKGLRRTYTEGDLSANLHFEGGTAGISKKAARAVNDLLYGWIRRYHSLNYVAGTYCYSQRFFNGYRSIIDITQRVESGEIAREAGFGHDELYTKEETDALHIVWRELVGEEYQRMNEKYCKGNRNPKFLEALSIKQRENLVAREYPTGFSTIIDLMNMAKILRDNKCGKR